MRRRNTAIDPAVAADLEALDAALAGERDDPVLETIADEVRASTPRMSPAFAARLEAAAARGFTGPEAAPGKKPRLSWRPPLMPALGMSFAVLAALVVGLSALQGSDSDKTALPTAVEREASGGGSAASGAVTERSAPQADAVAPQAPSVAKEAAPGAVAEGEAQVPSGAGQDTDTTVPPPGAGPRRIQRAADLTISTPIVKLQDTSDAVTATIDRLGGFVYRSNVSASGDSGQATFDLRVPTDRLDEALASLSRLGHVRSRTQASQDITARFSSALSRLHDARVERQALLRALAEATTPQEIESLRARLEIARSRIAAAKGDLFAARRASNLARLGVTVLGVTDDEGATGGGEPWTPRRGLEDAVDLLSSIAGVTIVVLAAAVPAGLLALLLGLGWRVHRRRRRELALDAPAPAV